MLFRSARVRRWPGDAGTVHLVTVDHAVPSPTVVERWVDRLAADGFHTVRTGALGPTAQPPFLEAGFVVRQELALLQHELEGVRTTVIPSERLLMRRGRSTDLAALAAIDLRAFGQLWSMDVDGIVDACRDRKSTRLNSSH